MAGVGTSKGSLEFGSGSTALQLFNVVDADVAIPSVGNVAISVLARASPVYWRLAASVHRALTSGLVNHEPSGPVGADKAAEAPIEHLRHAEHDLEETLKREQDAHQGVAKSSTTASRKPSRYTPKKRSRCCSTRPSPPLGRCRPPTRRQGEIFRWCHNQTPASRPCGRT